MWADLHMHSCLSPCADEDMTPANICGMAHIKGLQAKVYDVFQTTGFVHLFKFK